MIRRRAVSDTIADRGDVRLQLSQQKLGMRGRGSAAGELAKIVMLGATTRYIPEAEWFADEASSDQP
jgi:hypothetical protein